MRHPYLALFLFCCSLSLCRVEAQLSTADLTDGDEVELMQPAGEPVSVPGVATPVPQTPSDGSDEAFPWITVIIGVVVSVSLIEGIVVYRWIKRRREAAGE